MNENKFLLHGLLAATLLFAMACNNSQPENKTLEPAKKDTPVQTEPVVETKRGPVINIGDTLSIKRMVLTMKDSAATLPGISIKLADIYGVKLGEVIKKNNLQVTGSPVAWYKGEKAPYFFEAGIPVDKKPSRMPAGMYIKQIVTDSVVVAHFYGPYDLIPQAYDALKQWLTDHKKTMKGSPYEIYVDDPIDEKGNPRDPYQVRTDVVFAWK